MVILFDALKLMLNFVTVTDGELGPLRSEVEAAVTSRRPRIKPQAGPINVRTMKGYFNEEYFDYQPATLQRPCVTRPARPIAAPRSAANVAWANMDRKEGFDVRPPP